jgi:hypothetical protein
MHVRRNFLAIGALMAFSAGFSQAWAAKPDFSGTWKLDASKSEFGPMPAPDKWERTITHQDPSLKYKTVQAGPQGEMTTDTSYTTDGKESMNKFRGQDVKGVAKWDGDVLTIQSKREVQGMEISINERWTLSPDGKVLTIANAISTPQGDFETKIVADKQ